MIMPEDAENLSYDQAGQLPRRIVTAGAYAEGWSQQAREPTAPLVFSGTYQAADVSIARRSLLSLSSRKVAKIESGVCRQEGL